MKQLKYIAAITMLIFASCGGEEVDYDETPENAIAQVNYDEFLQELDELELKIAQDPTNNNLLKEAISKFQDFAGFFPDDARSPDYLLKASDFSLAVMLPEKSIKILDRIIENYPNYHKMEDVLYIRANHLDWELRDTTRAKEAYQKYIDTYPSSSRAVDAALRIKYIALSFEEYAEKIISDFEAGN